MTELAITWNNVSGVHDLSTPSQLIPFLVGLGVIGRVLILPIPNVFDKIELPTPLKATKSSRTARGISGARFTTSSTIEFDSSFNLVGSLMMKIIGYGECSSRPRVSIAYVSIFTSYLS
ncbi:hypothetical protein F4781DRAFT_219963 [Annulohypoxylon bovei var. microspora]|nr:hypothetical protein F4781DRAFT_219963 [Annulohypoxylon bovei var. microspora]